MRCEERFYEIYGKGPTGVSFQPLHLRIGVQLIEIANAQCQIGVGKQLNSLCLSKAHNQGVDVLLVIRIRAGENLIFGQAVGFRAIGVDLLHPAGFQPPGMVDENFSIYAELLI